MVGGIYTDEKCPICKKQMVDNKKSAVKGGAVACPSHPKQRAQRLRVVIKLDGKLIRRRFTGYAEAEHFLNGLRYEIGNNKFDPREFEKDDPLAFARLAETWLARKKDEVKRHSWDNLNNYMGKAIDAWGNRSVKDIQFAELDDFFAVNLKGLSLKSKANCKSVLHSFFQWVADREELKMPKLPKLPKITMAFRNTIPKDVQEKVLDKVREISWHVNPRIWVALKWLSTYFSIRPWEMVRIKEGEIRVQNGVGYFIITDPKEKEPKIVPMIDEDVDLVQSLPRSFPELPFFRHFKGIGGSEVGSQFGPKYLYKWWKKACAQLKIKDVDMYGGTRHSSVVHLGTMFTPEELQEASMHTTNKAFKRYYQKAGRAAIKNIYESNRGIPQKRGEPKGNQVLDFSKNSSK